MRKFLLFVALCSTSAFAEVGDKLADDGKLNPEQLTMNYFANEHKFSKQTSMFCTYGYWAAKSGKHETAQKIFDKCLAAGVDGAYPWKSFMAQNGYGVRQSFVDAADWDQKSAERGYKVGEYNYGMDLLRGLGVKQDIEQGRKLIDAAAAKGLYEAQEVKNAGYDPDVMVPDVEKPRIY